MTIDEIAKTIKENYVLYSGALRRKIGSFYPHRKIVMGVSIQNHRFWIWAMPVHYEGPNDKVFLIDQSYENIDDAVSYFLDFMRDSCKDVKEIEHKSKIILRTYPQPNALE